jgi:ankyrin repeat protein
MSKSFHKFRELFTYAYTGHTKELEDKMKEFGVDADFCDKSDADMTLLMYATMGGQYETCMRLVELGANINTKDGDGNTVLHHFLENRKKHLKWDIFQMFLDRGADPNIKNNGNYTPLYIAVQKEYLEACRMLLESGAKTDVRDLTNWTLLHYAYAKNNFELCKLLVEYGADVSATNAYGQKIYDMNSSHFRVYQYLLDAERTREELRRTFKRMQIETEDVSDDETHYFEAISDEYITTSISECGRDAST